ncbi:hypothetical protein ACFVH6_30425 [Spirillospora sp. NPDC127200]
MANPIGPTALATTPPRPDATPAPDTATTETTPQDLAALRKADSHQRFTRATVAFAFFLIGAAVALPVLPLLPVEALMDLAVKVLAALGVLSVYERVVARMHAWYQVTRTSTWRVFRWRISRRWYAPGSWVCHRHDDREHPRPLVVLAWHHDPACPQPWVLTYDGTPAGTPAGTGDGRGAVWHPLDHLTPAPDRAAAH